MDMHEYACIYARVSIGLVCWATHVNALVRTSGGCTGIRKPGTPVGPGVSVTWPICTKADVVCHGFVPFPLPAHRRPALHVRYACVPPAPRQWVQTPNTNGEDLLIWVQTPNTNGEDLLFPADGMQQHSQHSQFDLD